LPLVPRPSPAIAAEALVAVSALAARWIERLLAGHHPPLTPPQYLALRAIAQEPTSVSELARRAGVSGPAGTQLVNALETAGLVQRRAEPADRRRQRLVPSPAGRRALRSADALLTERLTALLEGLPRPEVDAFARALPVVEAAFSGSAPPRRPPPPRGPPPRPPASRRGGA
jgi:DNA-binding MarR family transcriptional regulator